MPELIFNAAAGAEVTLNTNEPLIGNGAATVPAFAITFIVELPDAAAIAVADKPLAATTNVIALKLEEFHIGFPVIDAGFPN